MWRRDGKELFYFATDRKLMSVSVVRGNSIALSLPKPLFEMRSWTSDIRGPKAAYLISPDGQKFLMVLPVDDGVPQPLTVVTHWQEKIHK
ncbi:MAG: hypothetical protein HY046_13685 [Acidobacteria bacterium]|nr:hypothetical protein [Acidobacteriota bacterium]